MKPRLTLRQHEKESWVRYAGIALLVLAVHACIRCDHNHLGDKLDALSADMHAVKASLEKAD